MINYQTMNRMRSLPRKIRTLEEKIEQDREEIQRIRNDLLHEKSHKRALRQRETKITLRIERNIEKLHQLRLENMELRQKMAEVCA